MIKRARCHVFGDGIPLDEGFIPFELAMQRVTDPQQLIPYLFKSIDPEFTSRVQPGDLVLAGFDFACGKPHVQGFIALAALQAGVVCCSMPYKNLRRAVACGLPVITGAPAPGSMAVTGDDVEVNFVTGRIVNHTQGRDFSVSPIPPLLIDILNAGGGRGLLKSWLANHPEQALSEEQVAHSRELNSSTIPINVVNNKM